jgi:hypothetical protein
LAISAALLSCRLRRALIFMLPERGVAGGAQQPRREDRLMAERGGLAGQDDEHRLRDFLGDVTITDYAQRRPVNEVDVTVRQLPKGIRLIPFPHTAGSSCGSSMSLADLQVVCTSGDSLGHSGRRIFSSHAVDLQSPGHATTSSRHRYADSAREWPTRRSSANGRGGEG